VLEAERPAVVGLDRPAEQGGIAMAGGSYLAMPAIADAAIAGRPAAVEQARGR
jgi:hypothetical protein